MHIEITIPEERIDGNIVTLDMGEILNIKRTYGVESIKEYVRDNHPDWSDEKICFVSKRAFDLFEDVERGDEELQAIKQAENEWEYTPKNWCL